MPRSPRAPPDQNADAHRPPAGRARAVDEAGAPAIFPQGGSTITQQLVRGHFLKGLTSVENSHMLQGLGRLPRSLSFVVGARNANMIARKAEEMRLSIWIEREMTRRFGSKQRAKEEIFARYASYVHGQWPAWAFHRRALLRQAAQQSDSGGCR